MSSVAGGVAEGMLRVDEERVRGHVDEVVRSSVEETLNGLLDAEADRLCGAGRYERSADRVDTRAGSSTTSSDDLEVMSLVTPIS